MSRTKGGPKTRIRRKRLLARAKGYYGARRKLYGPAKETVDRALAYAFAGRKQEKRQYRRLWISRLNAAVRPLGLSYSRFIDGLKRAKINIDRRALADLALHDAPAFNAIANAVKQAL